MKLQSTLAMKFAASLFLSLLFMPAAFAGPAPTHYPDANDTLYTAPWQRSGDTGVMLVPYSDHAAGDYAEQTLYLSSGEMPGINRVFAPNNGQDMLTKLGKLQRMGKKVDLLVIAGHAAEGTPGVFFGNGQALTPADVNAIDDLRNFEAQHPGVRNHLYQTLFDKARNLVQCKDLLTNNATIVLLNCDALETKEGRAFVDKLGQVLMGSRGGQVIASDKIIETKRMDEDTTKLDWLWTSLNTGRWLQPGDTAYKPTGGLGPSWQRVRTQSGSYPQIPDDLRRAINSTAPLPRLTTAPGPIPRTTTTPNSSAPGSIARPRPTTNTLQSEPGEHGGLRITVTDSESNEPLSGATITLAAGKTFSTNAQGMMEQKVKTGKSISIEIGLKGYEPEQLTVDIDEGLVTEEKVKLKSKDAVKPFTLDGSWQSSLGGVLELKSGQITKEPVKVSAIQYHDRGNMSMNGTFTPANKTLILNYAWGTDAGRGTFTLENENTLSGSYADPKGSGGWSLTRK